MLIKVENLHKAYGEKVLHQGITFEIPAGERCVILGGSGVGKSQLLRQIVGLVKPDRGKVWLGETEITGLSEDKLSPIRQKIGYIFQDGGLLQSLTVGENITLPLQEIFRPGKKKIAEKLDEVLNLLNLEGLADQPVSSLSGGQRKRVAIARALVCDVEVLFYDEPTAGLDPETASTVDQVIYDVNEKTKTTSIVVTHDIRTVEAVAQRVLMLHGGSVIFDGKPGDLFTSDEMVVNDFLKRELTQISAG